MRDTNYSRVTRQVMASFNQPETLLIISSFPQLGGEVAKDNAVARYTDLLVRHLPSMQKVVVVCERRGPRGTKPYLLTNNVLVVPSYVVNSPTLNWHITSTLNHFSQIKRVLLQIELSIFGNQVVTFGLPLLTALLRSQGKHVSVMLHQVVTDVADLGGHIQTSPAKRMILNTGLQSFYRLLGKSVDTLLVHDQTLKTALSRFVSPSNIKVIPHGVLPTRVLSTTTQRQARRQYRIPQDAYVVLAYGYQSVYKGTDWIAQVTAELSDSGLTVPSNNQDSPSSTKPGRARRQPRKLHLLLAGSTSPTQQHRPEYQAFLTKLSKTVSSHSDVITSLGFVPEAEVESVFAAADVVVFPYRGRMSASGALSLTWQYGKPFLVSQAAAVNLRQGDVKQALAKIGLNYSDLTFSLSLQAQIPTASSRNQQSFAQQLHKLAAVDTNLFATVGKTITAGRSWTAVAEQYLAACQPQPNLVKTKRAAAVTTNEIGSDSAIASAQKNTHSRRSKLPSLSVFFPMHNEEANVARVIEEAQRVIPTLAKKYEIIIVNDGSHDATSSIAHLYAQQDRHVRVIDQQNKGYGGALQTGFAAARYDWIFFSDGDLQFDLRELSLLINEVETAPGATPEKTTKTAVVLGYRRQRADSTKRIVLAKLLKIWNYAWFQFPANIKDIDCAFKLFHRSVIADIFPLHSQGAMLSTELLLSLVDRDYTYSQVGVTHLPRQAGHQTGASWHVVSGAVKETLSLFYHRNLEPLLSALPSQRTLERYFPVSLGIAILMYRVFNQK